jgi:hypothetical protein
MDHTLSLEGDEKRIKNFSVKVEEKPLKNLSADGGILLKRVMTKIILVSEMNSASFG